MVERTNNFFFKLNGNLSIDKDLKTVTPEKVENANIFMQTKTTDDASQINLNDYIDETKNYEQFGSKNFVQNLETMEDFAQLTEETGMFEGVKDIPLSHNPDLSKNTSAQTIPGVKATSSIPFETRIQNAQTARSEKAKNSSNVKSVDSASLKNKKVDELKNDKTREIQELNQTRQKADNCEKNSPEVTEAQNNVNDLQQQLNDAIQKESEKSENKEVKALKEQLDNVNKSVEEQQKTVDETQTQIDEADSQISEAEEAVTTAEENEKTAQESVDTAQESVDTTQTNVDTAKEAAEAAEENFITSRDNFGMARENYYESCQAIDHALANLNGIKAKEPSQNSFTKTDESGKSVPDTAAYNSAHNAWLAEVQEAEKALEEAKAESSMLYSEFTETSKKLEEAEEKYNEAKEKQTEAENALEEAQTTLEDAQTALEEAQTALEEAETTLEEAQDKLAELNEQLVESQDLMTALNEEKSDLEQQIAEAITEENPDSKVSELKKQSEAAKNNLEQTKQNVKNGLDNDIAKLEQNVEKYDAAIQEAAERENKPVKSIVLDEKEYNGNTSDPTKTKTVQYTNPDGSTYTLTTIQHQATGKKTVEEKNGDNTVVKEYGKDGKLERTTETNVTEYTGNTSDPTKTKAVKTTDKDGNTVTETTVNHLSNGTKTVTTEDADGKKTVKEYDKNGNFKKETTTTESSYAGNTSDPTKTKTVRVKNADGTVKEETTINHLANGKKTVTTADEEGNSITKDYDKDGNLLKESRYTKYTGSTFGMSDTELCGPVLPDSLKGENVSYIYDKNGNIKSVSAYNVTADGTKTRIDLDSKIGTSHQRQTGDCWALSGINSLSYNEKGREILNNAIEYGEDGATIHTHLGNYDVTYEELEDARHAVYTDDDGNITGYKYSTGDADVLMLELATEKLRADIASGKIEVKDSDHTVFASDRQTKDYVDSADPLSKGLGNEFIYYFTGNQAVCESGEKGTDKLLNRFMDSSDNYTLTSTFKKDVTVKDLKGNEVKLFTAHSYSVKNVTENSVTVVNPWNSSEDIVLSREEFLKYSGGSFLTDITEKDK